MLKNIEVLDLTKLSTSEIRRDVLHDTWHSLTYITTIRIIIQEYYFIYD